MRSTALVALSALLAAGGASAQRAPGSPSERSGVRRSARAAEEAFEQGDFEGALQLFQTAFRTDPQPRLRRSLAECYEALRRPQEAIYHLERYLEEARGLSDADESDIRARIAAHRARLSTVRVRVTPNDALDLTVTVDGLTIPPEGVTRVGAGVHSVQAAAEGFRAASASLQTAEGGLYEVQLTLRPMDLGPLQVVTAPRPSPPTRPPRSPGPFFATLGGTVACVTAWAAAGALALDARREYDEAQRDLLARSDPNALARRSASLARAERLALISDVALGAAVAGAVVTAVLGVRADFRAPSVELDAAALPGGAALTLSGRF
ncbi:MAG: tetratricopeptide repeat protein [Polyangiales bacterium]